MRFYNARDLEMVRTSTSVRRTSTITKSTAGTFVVTNSCSPSGDMLGGCISKLVRKFWGFSGLAETYMIYCMS